MLENTVKITRRTRIQVHRFVLMPYYQSEFCLFADLINNHLLLDNESHRRVHCSESWSRPW
jgi:hypothetical protein